MGTRLTIDSLTCLLANETDPSRLVAVSPGKLVRYLVEDGAHVNKDQPYIEIEVPPPPSPSILKIPSSGFEVANKTLQCSALHPLSIRSFIVCP